MTWNKPINKRDSRFKSMRVMLGWSFERWTLFACISFWRFTVFLFRKGYSSFDHLKHSDTERSQRRTFSYGSKILVVKCIYMYIYHLVPEWLKKNMCLITVSSVITLEDWLWINKQRATQVYLPLERSMQRRKHQLWCRILRWWKPREQYIDLQLIMSYNGIH